MLLMKRVSFFQSEIAMNYMKATNFVMLGGLMLAVCVEHSGLHKRIALRIILMLGTSPKMVMFGFMVTTAFVSMFISNAATTAMMLPIVEAFAIVMDVPDVSFHFDRKKWQSIININSNSLQFDLLKSNNGCL